MEILINNGFEGEMDVLFRDELLGFCMENFREIIWGI